MHLRPVFKGKISDINYPHIRDIWVILYVSISTLILAYAGMFGAAPILIFYTIWLPHIYYKKKFIVRFTKDIRLPLIIAGYAILSTAWSENIDVTAKSSLEAASMIICSIVIARITSLSAFLKGIIIGTALVLVASLINGTYGIDYFTGTYSLVGLFASKNQVGLFAEIGIFSTLLFLFSTRNIFEKIFFVPAPFCVCMLSLYLSRSASSDITLAFTLCVCCGVYVLTKFPPSLRKPLLTLGLFLAIALVTVGAYLDLQSVGLGIFGKDTTLTGRTYLWAQGLKFGLRNPVLGVGYADFWVHGRPLAEALWFKFDIFGRMGFHFHDTYIQTFVDLGAVGFFIVASIFIINCVKSFQYTFHNDASVLGYFCLGFSFMFLSRSFVEIDIGGTFGIGSLIFYAILPRLALNHNKMPNPNPSLENLTKLKPSTKSFVALSAPNHG